MSGKLSDKLFDIINYTIQALFSLSCLYPFYYILCYSLSDPMQASIGRAVFFPSEFTLRTFNLIFEQNDIFNAIGISVSRTVLGTAVTLFCSSFLAYLITKKKLRIRKFVYRFLIATMYFNAGLIPYYVTMKMLGFQDNFLVYVIPGAVSAFFVILYKTYLEQLPADFEESAMVDGAGVFRIYAVILMPLCMPVTAAITVFSSVAQWNSWFDNMLFITNRNLDTLQYLLYQYLAGALAASDAARSNTGDIAQAGRDAASAMTPTSIRMAITVIAIFPICAVYPFMQRYFIKGIMIGAIKG